MEHKLKSSVAITLATIISTLVSGQTAAGLYGECDRDMAKYMCQQILLDSTGHFEYYDYLHLNGKKINYGTWIQKNDTIILNSTPQPKIVYHKSERRSDSITIRIIDTSAYAPSGSIFINADTIGIGFTDSNAIKIPYQNIEKIFIRFWPNYFVLNFSPAELGNVDSITIYIQRDFRFSFVFKDEKWLISGDKLLHSRLPNGEFDKERGYTRTQMKNKRF